MANRLNILNRKIHYWATVLVALPTLTIIGSGLMLQMKKQWTWVQPPEQRGTGTAPVLDLHAILAAAQANPNLGVTGWDDVNRIDLRPSRGLAKVWLRSGWEVQVDLGTGRVLQTAYRRSDLIESIHDGSWLAGDWTKLGVVLPTGIILLVMWFTGLWMFVAPIVARRIRAKNLKRRVEALGID
jgi:hypothetical protein